MARRKRRALHQQSPKPIQVEAKAGSTFERRPWLKQLIVAAVLCGITLLAYSNSFNVGFTYDSRAIVLENPSLREATTTNVDSILGHTYWWPTSENNLYRPITTLSYLFNYSVLGKGESPAGYHWINFLLHAANVLLAYGIALALLKRFWMSAFAAALWAVHPVLTESVTNIVGRADLLAGVALLGGFLMFLQSAKSSGWRKIMWLSGLMVSTTIGVFSKENAVAILGVILIYWLAWGKEQKGVRGFLLGCAVTVPPILVMLYQRSVVLAHALPQPVSVLDNPIATAGFLRGKLTAVAVMGKYIWLLVWPVRLSSDYSYAQIPLAHGGLRDWIAWIAVGLIVLAAFFQLRRKREWFFFPAFAFVTLAPTANLFFSTGAIMAERFLYVPALGFAVCLVMALDAVGRRIELRALAPALMILILCGFALRTWARNRDWKDDLTLWTAAVEVSPNSSKAHKSLAAAMYRSDSSHSNIARVIEEAQKGVALIDSLPTTDLVGTSDSYSDLGLYYLVEGNQHVHSDSQGHAVVSPESAKAYQKAVAALTRAAAIDNADNELHRRTARAHGIPDAEIRNIGSSVLYQNLGLAFLRTGDTQKAVDAALHARALRPEQPEPALVLAQIYASQNKKEDAALSLLEGLFMTGNLRFLGPLDSLYRSGLDSESCAIIRTANGPTLNKSCKLVHDEVCKALAEAAKFYRDTQRGDLAEQARAKAVDEFGCTANLPDLETKH
jgi:tetratricopeptide (TPR) repeat protein